MHLSKKENTTWIHIILQILSSLCHFYGLELSICVKTLGACSVV